jgi:manganese/zinc/iron transport system substrate-binding protein
MLEQTKVRVFSTTAMIDDLVAKIGGEYVVHLPLILGEIDPHSYELVKGDDEKLSHAQVVFYNGLGLEHGASLRYALQHHPAAIAIGDQIQRENPELILIEKGHVDPHIWMDISLWAKAIDPIIAALSQKDPEHAGDYQKNGEVLRTEMLQMHQEILGQMDKVASAKRFLVTSHDAFNYFARAYLAFPGEKDWQKRFEAPEGLSPDGQLSATDIQRIIDHICRYQITVLFPESNVSRDSLKKIVAACKEKGITVTISSQVLYGDSMGEETSEAHHYLSMIAHDADVLISAWE